MELEEWKGEAGRERVAREAHASAHAVLERELLALKGERDTLRMDRDTQAESASNLHLVLEEFQAGTSCLSCLGGLTHNCLDLQPRTKN